MFVLEYISKNSHSWFVNVRASQKKSYRGKVVYKKIITGRNNGGN